MVKMNKKFLLIPIILSSLLLCGCWSYRGLDEIEIVSGMAIDKGTGENKYKITLEIFDVSSSSKDEGSKQKILQAEGKSIFDAVRNAKRKLLRRPYFSHMDVVFINKEIAAEEGLYSIVDFFLRDGEMREAIYFVISKEESAETLFQGEPADSPILSVQISHSIRDDNKSTSSTYDSNLIDVYNSLMSPGLEVTLPVVHLTQNEDHKVAELDGISVFKKDKLQGFLSPQETKFFLLIMDNMEGGILTLPIKENHAKTIDLEIVRSKTKKTFERNNGKIKIIIEPHIKAFLAGINYPVEKIDEEYLSQIEKLGEEFVKKETLDLVKKIQSDYAVDIFGFGNLIYKKEPKYWEEIVKDWDNHFKNLEVEVKPTITILNTAFVRNNATQPKYE